MRRGYGLSYDGWLDAPYNEGSAECCDCGDEISGEVYVDKDGDREYVYCEDCYNADRDKLYTFVVPMNITVVGRGKDEAEALENALDEFDVIDQERNGQETVLEWEYDD